MTYVAWRNFYNSFSFYGKEKFYQTTWQENILFVLGQESVERGTQ